MSKPWFYNLNINRELITFVNRIRSLHTSCADHLFRKNIVNDNLCDCETGVQDLNHAFFNCPRLGYKPDELLDKIYRLLPDFDRDIHSLSFSGNVTIYNLLLNFAKENNIIIWSYFNFVQFVLSVFFSF